MNVKETTAECPHCRQPMLQLQGVEGVLAGCKGCGGVWLDNVLSRRAAETPMSGPVQEFVSSLGAGFSSAAAPASNGRDAAKAKRSCPVCHAALKPVRVRDPEMTVDICASHGTFFDRYELDALHRIALRNAELAALSAQIDVEQAARDRAWAMSQAGFQGGLLGAALVAMSYEDS